MFLKIEGKDREAVIERLLSVKEQLLSGRGLGITWEQVEVKTCDKHIRR